MNMEMVNIVSNQIVIAAVEVHKTLGGPGLLESVYEEALVWELQTRGVRCERQKLVPIKYKTQTLATPLRLDLLVEGCVVVECKAVESMLDIHESQLLTYLRLTGLKLGLLINFGAKRVKDGIKRMIN